MFQRIKDLIRHAAEDVREMLGEQTRLQAEIADILGEIGRVTPDNPALHGYKVYSQCDEDGIIAHLFRVLGGGATFVEIGCSDGLENNTHALLLSGWRGAWIDADEDKIASLRRRLPNNPTLQLRQQFVTAANAGAMVGDCLAAMAAPALDLLSVDIDGDDLGVLLAILDAGIAPRVICIEYNAKFPPPMSVAFRSRRGGGWQGDDYQGASLTAITDALAGRYRLVACNASGANAFFVREADAAQFPGYSPRQLFRPARYHLRRLRSGHRPSLDFLADRLAP